MERSAARTILWVGVSGIIILGLPVAVWLLAYDIREFRGEGSISDSGFSSYPRYQVLLPEISLSKPREFDFHVRGLPSEQMTFVLHLTGRGDYQRLTSLKTRVDVEIRSVSGSIERASGALREWELAWVPAHENGEFWDQRLRNLQIHRNDHYSIRIRVSDVDHTVPSLHVAPMLEGGGNELP